MAFRFIEFSNLSAGTNPLPGPNEGLLGTPVPYDPYAYANAGVDPPINLGLGTKYQIPTKSQQHIVDVAWRWLGATVDVTLHIDPSLKSATAPFPPGGDVTGGGGVDIPIHFEIGRQDTPFDPDEPGVGSPPQKWPKIYRAPGPDLTTGSTRPLNRTYSAYDDDTKDPQNPAYDDPPHTPLTFLLANYPPEETLGVDSFFCSPVITASIGLHTLQTVGLNDDASDPEAGTVLYWCDNIEFTVTWQYYISGPGNAEAIPPIAAIPLQQVIGPPATDSGDDVNLPQILTTVFDPTVDYTDEYELAITDSLATGTQDEEKRPKNRVFSNVDPINFSPVSIGSDATITVTAYYATRTDKSQPAIPPA